nr:hypothetical protein [Tanacetum cinerariifolium]
TNNVSTTYSVSFPPVSKSQKEGSSSYTDEVIHSFFANQSSAPQLDYDDLKQINDDDMEYVDLKWQPGLDTLSFDDLYNNLKVFEHDVKGTTASSSSNIYNVAFVTADNTSSTNNVSTTYSVSFPFVLKSQKEGSLSYTDEVIHSFFANQSSAPQLDYDDLKQINDDDMEYVDLKWQVILLETAKLKGIKTAKEEMGTMETKLEIMEDARNYAMMAYSSSNLGSDNEESDLENTSVNDKYVDGMHVIPPPITGNYMSSGPDVEIDYFKFTYGSKQTSVDESDSKSSEYASCKSDSSVETTTFMPALVKNAPKVVCEPKVWTDAPIIQEYESDSDNDSVSNVQEDKEKPSFAFTDSVKHVKPSRENVKETGTPNRSPKVKNQDRNDHTRKGLCYAFTRKACFVCGSFSHLIRDCDF